MCICVWTSCVGHLGLVPDEEAMMNLAIALSLHEDEVSCNFQLIIVQLFFYFLCFEMYTYKCVYPNEAILQRNHRVYHMIYSLGCRSIFPFIVRYYTVV